MALRKNSKSFIKWGLYSIILLFLYALQTAPAFLVIGKIKPVLLIPLAISISLFESEVGSAIFGLFTGFLWDFSACKIFGFYGILIMICCVCITLLSMYLIRVNIINALASIAAASLICNIWDFIFYYLIWGYDDIMLSFWQHFLSSVYTVILAAPFYYLVRFITTKFSTTIRN